MRVFSDKRPDTPTLLAWASAAMVGGILFLGPFPTGLQGASHWPWGAIVGVLAGVTMLISRTMARRAFRIDPLILVLCGLGGLLAFQLIPLPAGVMGVISPTRLSLARELASVSGRPGPEWLPITVCPKLTRDGLLLFIGAVSVFYASSKLIRLRGAWRLPLAAAAASGAILAVYGLIALLFGEPGSLTATYTNRNRFAGFLAIAGASALGLYLAEREPGVPPWRRALPLAAAVLIEVALVFTLSRLGIAAAALAGLLTIALFARRRSIWAASVSVLCLVAVNMLLGISPLLERYSLLFESGRSRMHAWSMTLPMALDYPVFGSGEATYRQLFALYQQPDLPGWWVNAHNDYLTILVEGGILALAGVIAVAILFFRRIVPMSLSSVRKDRAIAAAGFLAVTAEIIHSLGDYPLRQPANLLAFASVTGLVYGRARRRDPPGRTESEAVLSAGKTTGLRLALAGILCIAVIPILIAVWRAETLKAEATGLASVESAPPKNADRALELLASAARADAWDGEARLEAARLRAGMLSTGAGRDDARKVTTLAIADARSGLRTTPLDPRLYYLLGILTWRSGSEADTDRMMTMSLRLGRAWHDVSYNVGAYFLRRWRLERESRSGFGLTRWKAGKDSELLREASKALSMSVRSPRAKRQTIDLVLGQPLSAAEIDLLLDPDPKIDLALARSLARQGRHAEAEERFSRALRAGTDLSPESPAGAHASYARSLLTLGKIDDALDQFRRSLVSSAPEERGHWIRFLGRLRVPKDAAPSLADWWNSISKEIAGIEDDPAYDLALGRAELAAGRTESGTRHLLKYAEETNDAAVYAELATRALARGRPEVAVKLASEAASLKDSAKYELLLSRAFRNAGCETEALSALQRALVLDPRNLRAARDLAKIELAASRPEKAARLWRLFLEAGGDVAAGHEGLADVYSALLDRGNAIRELRKSLQTRPGDKRLRRKLQNLLKAD